MAAREEGHMNKDKRIVLCMAMSFMLILSGCQKTPDKSSVVSKADGLSEELIAKPLESGETRTVDMPEHWSALEKKSNDKVTISADLDLGKLYTGNLPVVEMANHTLTQRELKEYAEYFADGEELYVPQVDTKEVFQKVIDRIDQKEGVYANPTLAPFSGLKSALEAAVESAPETPPEDQKAEFKFHKKSEDIVEMASESWYSKLWGELEQTPDAEVFFSADVGKNRLSHIEARSYNHELANSSSFVWKTGTGDYSLEYIQQAIRMNEYSPDTSEYKEEFRNLLNQFQETLEQGMFSKEEGQKQAENVIKDLDIPDMSLLSTDKILWFPEEAAPDRRYGESDDFYWQADLENVKIGYRYEFTRSFGGISADSSIGGAAKDTADTYTAPFPIEMVSIIVTDDGVKSFSWQGMCKEVAVIAENVNLLAFDDIQKSLFEQIFYSYLNIGQPAEDTTKFDYRVISAKLGYTYVTAFQKPENAWMVPTWFFQVMRSEGQAEDMKDLVILPVAINAMDGGVIVAQ